MSLEALLADFRAKVEPIIGVTGLSNPAENIADPLVQIVMHALGGQAELEKRLTAFTAGFDVRTADCVQLEQAASLIGEARRTAIPSTVEIIFVGASGTLIPANTAFKDNYLGVWRLENPVTLINGLGFGVAKSTVGAYQVEAGELALASAIAGIQIATSGQMLSLGGAIETCEQFRARLLAGRSYLPDTEEGILEQLSKVATKVKLIHDAPDCIAPYSKTGFVVVGGSDQVIAETLQRYAPYNYTRLAGNTSITLGCETVRFIRPCPVGLQLHYWATTEVEDDVFANSICRLDTITSAGLVALIPCLKHVKFRAIPSRPEGTNTEPEQATGCNGVSVSLIAADCPCADTSVLSSEFSECITLQAWQAPAFISAEYRGQTC